MNTLKLSEVEKNFSLNDLQEAAGLTEEAKGKIAAATSAADVKTEICTVWSTVRQYVIWAEAAPFAGQYIKLLAELLDAICPGN